MTTSSVSPVPKNLSPDCLIGLKRISELIETVIWTGSVRDEDPVSAVLIAPQESAKTELLKQYRGTVSLEFFSDLTARGLTAFKSDIESGRLRHIVLLDLIRILAHPRVTADRTIQTIAGLIEEGQANIADAGGVERWKGDVKLPRIGALIGVTPAVYERKRKMFRDTGFMSRFLPVRYSYSEKTSKAIHYAIEHGTPKPSATPIKLPEKKLYARISPQIATLVKDLGQSLGVSENTYGFRWHRAMRCLAKARAIKNRRGVVTLEDFRVIENWCEFFEGEVIL